MIRSIYFEKTGQMLRDVPISELPAYLQDPQGLLWVDFENTATADDEPILRQVFGFHPLAIDDALNESHVPKLDDWGKYLYIVLHAVSYDRSQSAEVDTQELDIFLGHNYMVTHHEEPILAIERLWNTIHRDERHLKSGPDHLLYRLTDEVVASYMPVMEALDDDIDHTEDDIFGRPEPRTLEHIFALKRSAVHLRRIIAPQREVLNKLARDDFEVIDENDRVYFRDVYDHLVRLHDITESVRDLIGGSLDTYLSVINNRMNEIMKTLTIITTLFMPLSFLTGFFGMNFFEPSGSLLVWTTRPSFYLTMGIILGTPVVMWMWMRRRGWM